VSVLPPAVSDVGPGIHHGRDVTAAPALLHAVPRWSVEARELPLVEGPASQAAVLRKASPVRASAVILAGMPRDEELRGKHRSISAAGPPETGHHRAVGERLIARDAQLLRRPSLLHAAVARELAPL